VRPVTADRFNRFGMTSSKTRHELLPQRQEESADTDLDRLLPLEIKTGSHFKLVSVPLLDVLGPNDPEGFDRHRVEFKPRRQVEHIHPFRDERSPKGGLDSSSVFVPS